MTDTFCLYLLHRHGKLDANEAIVRIGTSWAKMNQQAAEKDYSDFGNLYPTTWMTRESSMVPVELSILGPYAEFAVPRPLFWWAKLTLLGTWWSTWLHLDSYRICHICCPRTVATSFLVSRLGDQGLSWKPRTGMG